VSATGRAGVRDSRDFYRTPAWCVERVLPFLHIGSGAIVDPGCGDGAIGEALRRTTREHAIYGIESDEELAAAAARADVSPDYARVYSEVLIEDFLGLNGVDGLGDEPTFIGNPPYRDAMAFIEQSLRLAGPGGTVCFLLRLAWLAGQKRRDFHQQHPADIYVLSRRPSFTGKGTDATDYAWFAWGPGPRGRVAVL
jgi:hypothetical protein